jgi:lysophospholipid acyltransferase (LPLAT)-like uncharacterized protein
MVDATPDPTPGPTQETRSGRRLTALRRLLYRLGLPVAMLLVRFWWRTCRVVRVIGDENAAEALADGAIIPVYWHGQQLFSVQYLLQQRVRGLALGFLISPSVDGELPAMAARLVGARVIRGSSNNTGARALRDYYLALKEGISPSITPDGPSGPRQQFKPGAILVSQLSGRPILPISFAASRGWRFTAWDRFLLPWPFARIVVNVGRPQVVPKRLDPEQLAQWQDSLRVELDTLYEVACAALSTD